MAFLRTAAACTLAFAASGSATALASSTVSVATSRGAFDMVVFAPKDSASADRAKPLVFLASGEGGWRKFDDLIAGCLSDAGYWVGGLDVMGYFWKAQDDREALASDARAYASALAKAAGRPEGTPIVLAGFSFGADLSPWIAGAGGWGKRVAGLLMIGPDETGSLEFRVSEILGFSAKDHIFKVSDALATAAGVPVLFIHGEKDHDSAAPALHAGASEPKKILIVPDAGHHFSGKEDLFRSALVEGMAWIALQHPAAPRSAQAAP